MARNNTNNNKRALMGVLLVLLLMGCYACYELLLVPALRGSTLIDNPTAKAITVGIDDKVYNVPARSFEKIRLSEGHHRINCKEHNITDQDLDLDPTAFGVINPTQSKYVIYNIIYSEKNLKSQFKPYMVEGREVYSMLGEPEVTTALFIPDRTLGKGNIDDKAPSVKDYNRMNQDYSFLTKIFRLNDFFDFYDKNNQ